MNFSLSSKAIAATKTDCLVIGLPEKGTWPDTTTQADETLGGLIKQLEKAGDLTGKNASVNTIPLVDQPWQRLIVVGTGKDADRTPRSEEHTSELQSRPHLVCRLLLEKK